MMRDKATGNGGTKMHHFLTNETEIPFLNYIRENLRTCTSFSFSVSFIKIAGLQLLLRDIEAALERGCEGRLITSTYQNFTDIESLQSFFTLMNRYSNFSCHLDFESFHDDQYRTRGYHSKGYLFEFEDHTEVVVGSSNITRYALLKNIEWDVAVKDEELYRQAMEEFDSLFDATHELTSELIAKYSVRLHYAIERWDMDYDLSVANKKPNSMQRKALKELNRNRAMGIKRSLIVAAAGSGKIFLAAFDALNFNPNRLLYIVHESSILMKSLETFQMVFGNDVTYGVFNGQSKEAKADFVFATNITMSKRLEDFSPHEFDYIIIDECHHATAETYKRILQYFEPEFLLGLTATPERMDNQDVFELFDENVPYELRLRDAIMNDLVVPFHYYGIRDQLVDYGLTDREERRLLAQMASEDHGAFIEREIENHRPEGKLKAIAFCRNVTHARMMSELLGEQYHTAYLTGKNNIGERIRAYQDLQSDTQELEILFTVDILNEGVDIPGVNMVLFLRPTDSSTIFIQQLGRGLRKYPGKDYVTVLDFIGNSYKRSVQIAFALSSLSENFVLEKRLMASLVRDNFKAIGLEEYGVNIQIDNLSKEEMLYQIEQENFYALRYLKQDYFNFKKYINAPYYPSHMDYWHNDCAPDLLRFMTAKIGGRKTNCYYKFLVGIEEDGLPIFSQEQIEFLEILSSLLPLVRPHEYLMVRALLQGMKDKKGLDEYLASHLDSYQSKELDHAFQFFPAIMETEEGLKLKTTLDDQFQEHLEDLLQYGLTRYEYEEKPGLEDGEDISFRLYGNYRMDQVQRKLLNNPGYNAVGTYYKEDFVIIFASLKKDLPEEDKLNYKDKFLESALFQWESMANLPASHLEKLKSSRFVHLFIRKMKDENGFVLPFTYVGKGHLQNCRSAGSDNGTYLFDVKMEHELPDYLQYDFGLM